MDRISEHISYAEATRSQTATRYGIKNEPNAEQLENMKAVAIACFEPARKWWGKPLSISSFFRCQQLNRKVGSKDSSQHPLGMAIDTDTGSNSDNKKLLEWMKANLKFDQLIWEYGDEAGPSWVHISFNRNGGNRNQYIVIK